MLLLLLTWLARSLSLVSISCRLPFSLSQSDEALSNFSSKSCLSASSFWIT